MQIQHNHAVFPCIKMHKEKTTVFKKTEQLGSTTLLCMLHKMAVLCMAIHTKSNEHSVRRSLNKA